MTRQPSPLTFSGRKGHSMTYSTFLGRDSVEGLKAWRKSWAEKEGRTPGGEDLVFMGKGGPMCESWINLRFREAALRLTAEGIAHNGSPRSWHSHRLRHSFSTECQHAGVNPQVREYWMGHTSGVQWIYQHPELHVQDLEKEYAKVEPYVSLDETETTLRDQYEGKERALVSRVVDLERKLEALLAQREAALAP